MSVWQHPYVNVFSLVKATTSKMVAHEGDVKQVMVRISKRSLHYTARVLHPIARTCYPHLPAYAGVWEG